ncbi:hypothetical protein OCGS_1488 [Oceaniovalibus guishaninsula JLT2003]|uniref:Uncharacterized protein n=1 Tax=Oceaniovalibus guishaninsula JLT2003 TaxID=1231392 RepID=K2I6R2_9RHOB|nr:hypothetical protein [Oceaniovalibus guishaninsula]EKE44650.1 hypothetical protein OCGS_1488 [Oceaniovalibus guishaninsula JLT2003]
MDLSDIEMDWQVFAREGGVGVGAVRMVEPDRLIVNIEGYSDVTILPEQIDHVDEGKVILDMARLPEDVRAAIESAHSRETRP